MDFDFRHWNIQNLCPFACGHLNILNNDGNLYKSIQVKRILHCSAVRFQLKLLVLGCPQIRVILFNRIHIGFLCC